VSKDCLQVSLGDEEKVLGQVTAVVSGRHQALGAHLDLSLRLLAGNVQDAPDVTRHGTGHLQQQSGFPDARITADEHERTGHDTASQDARELAHGHVPAFFRVALDLAHAAGSGGGYRARHAVSRRGHHLLNHRIPAAAAWTAAKGTRRGMTALLADELCLRTGHIGLLGGARAPRRGRMGDDDYGPWPRDRQGPTARLPGPAGV
jgi:hypothetical protein